MMEKIFMLVTSSVNYEGGVKLAVDLFETKELAIQRAEVYTDAQKAIEGSTFKACFEYGEQDLVVVPGMEFEKPVFAIRCDTSFRGKDYSTWRAVIEKKITYV